MTESKMTFNQKLIVAMMAMDNPKKEKEGYNYKYETLEQVLEIVRKALAEQGMMIVQGVKWNDSINEFILETGVMDGTEERILDMRPFHRCDDAQAEGSWETYMRRYAIRTAFGLTGEDDDGAATIGKSQNNGSYGATGGSRGMSGAASDKQIGAIHGKLMRLATLRNVDKAEAEEGLKAKLGVDGLDNLTKSQASEAITLLTVWLGKAQDEAQYAEEDIEF